MESARTLSVVKAECYPPFHIKPFYPTALGVSRGLE